jgi:hypothetical protein
VNLGNWRADGLVHEIIDDEDDHRELISKCGRIFPWIHPSRRVGIDEAVVTCFQCLTLKEAQAPAEHVWRNEVLGVYVPYEKCNVPMCGESGLCRDCRKKGYR